MTDPLVTAPLFTPNAVETVTDDVIRAGVEGGRVGDLTPRELPPTATAIRLQILALQVMGGLNGFLGLGSGGVYVVSSVVDGLGTEPITFTGKAYRGIRDGDLLPLGPTNDPRAVFNVYLREKPLPRALSFCLLVVRSDQELRDVGAAVSQVMADDRYKKLAEIATTAVSAAAPAYGTLLQSAQEAIGLIGGYLKVKPDDQLGYYQANYTNSFDDLGVGRHPPDARTFQVDKIRLGYQIDAYMTPPG
jgi:hypothetical protein